MTGGARGAAIVTGGSTGIGRHLSIGLAADGYGVVIGYHRGAAAAEEVRSAIEADGGRATTVGGDIADPATAAALVAAADTLGELEVICAHAGLTLFGEFTETTREDLDRLVDTNVRGTFLTVQAAVRRMLEIGRGGRVVMTSSVTGQRGIAGLAAYGMTKTAIEALARGLAVELSPHGITVNAVAPGSIDNDRNRAHDPHYDARWAAVNPVGRVGSGADVLAAVRFLVGPDASFVSGQVLTVDGGWTALGATPEAVERAARQLPKGGPGA